MKRLICKAEIDLSKYKNKFVCSEMFTEAPVSDGRSDEKIPVFAVFRLERTDETDDQWTLVKQTFSNFKSEDQAAEYIGKDVILNALNTCIELNIPITWNDMNGLYTYMDSDEYFEITFEADVYNND